MKSRLLVITVMMIWMSCGEQQDLAPLPSDVPNFKSIEELNSSVSKIYEMSDAQFSAWEKEKGFKSYYSHWREANDEFENVNSEEQLATFMKKYGDMVKIENNELLPKLADRVYQKIVNRQGFYQTTNVMNRVIGEQVYYTKLDDWKKLISFNPADAAREKIQSHSYRLSNEGFDFDSNAKTASTCTGGMVGSVTVDVGGCTGDRQSWVRMETNLLSGQSYIEIGNGEGYYINVRQLNMYFYVWGRKKNVLCNWKDYATQLEWHGITYSIVGWQVYNRTYYGSTVIQTYSNQVTINGTVADYYGTSDETQHISGKIIGDVTVNETWPVNPPLSATMYGKSRGVAGQYASIQCQ